MQKEMIEQQTRNRIAEETRRHEERLRAERKHNEALDREAKRKGFSFWDLVPGVGVVRRAMIDIEDAVNS